MGRFLSLCVTAAATAAFALSPAGTPATQISSDAAGTCGACHVGDPEGTGSPPVDLEALSAGAHASFACGDCHSGVTAAHAPDLPDVDCRSCHVEAADGFRHGVHWRKLSLGNEAAPGCTACHGHHGIQPADSLASPVNHERVSATCGSCHREALRLFARSSHGLALADDAKRDYAPTCVTCHGEHGIRDAGAPASPISPERMPGTCGGCHDDPAFAEAMGIAGNRRGTYSGSMHGLRNRFGTTIAASCDDCHGAHLVLPASDPESTISPGNIVATCGACHPGANENFVKAPIHVEATPENSLGVFAVRWFYIIFIAVLGIGFVTHIAFDFIEARRRRKEDKHG